MAVFLSVKLSALLMLPFSLPGCLLACLSLFLMMYFSLPHSYSTGDLCAGDNSAVCKEVKTLRMTVSDLKKDALHQKEQTTLLTNVITQFLTRTDNLQEQLTKTKEELTKTKHELKTNLTETEKDLKSDLENQTKSLRKDLNEVSRLLLFDITTLLRLEHLSSTFDKRLRSSYAV